MKVTIEVPYAKLFDDYHEIDSHAEEITLATGRLKGYECGFEGYYYIGIFYVGRRPKREVIKQIVKRDLDLDDKNVRWTWEQKDV